MDVIGPAPPTPALDASRSQRVARVVLAVGLTLLGLWTLQGLLRALAWAGILAIATWPLYQRARRRWPPGRHDIALPALFTLGITLLLVVPLALAAVQLGREFRVVLGWLREAQASGVPAPSWLAQFPLGGIQAAAWWQANLADPESASALLGRLDRADMFQIGRQLGAQLVHRAILLGFTLLALFFLLRDGTRITAQMRRASRRLLGPRGERLGEQVVASVHGTVDGLVLVGLGEGALLGIAYAVAGVPHPTLLGALTAVAAMIPLGAPLVFGAASLLLLAQEQALAAAALFVFGLVVVFVADHAVRPVLIGGATRLPFLWVLLGIVGGVETFGLLGLFFGPAIMAALILLWRDWTRAEAGS